MSLDPFYKKNLALDKGKYYPNLYIYIWIHLVLHGSTFKRCRFLIIQNIWSYRNCTDFFRTITNIVEYFFICSIGNWQLYTPWFWADKFITQPHREELVNHNVIPQRLIDNSRWLVRLNPMQWEFKRREIFVKHIHNAHSITDEGLIISLKNKQKRVDMWRYYVNCAF